MTPRGKTVVSKVRLAAMLSAAMTGMLLSGVCREATAGPLNIIQQENAQPGSSDWQLTNPAGLHEIEGYASLASVPVGGDINLFVNTQDPSFSLTIYRMGWYGGKGGRRVQGPQNVVGTRQPPPVGDPGKDLIECHWINPSKVHVPSSWVSGIYLVKLHGNASGKESYIIFTVRDGRKADLVYQQSVLTYHAYNPWGGQSLYGFETCDLQGNCGIQLDRVSFDRPYGSFYGGGYGVGAGDFLYNYAPPGMDINLVRWLERQGYDVTYITDVDTHESLGQLLRGKGFISAGHDEYVSEEMKLHMTQARDRGVGLAFLGGNYDYWPVALRPDSAGSPDRTIVLTSRTCEPHKENAPPTSCHSDADCDQDGTLRCKLKECTYACLVDSDGTSKTEQKLVGGMWDRGKATDPLSAVSGWYNDIVITDDARLDHWVFANTGLRSGDVIPGLIGPEWNSTREGYPTPDGLIVLAHTQAANFAGPYAPQLGGYKLPDDFDGKDFDGWYKQFIADGSPLSYDCDTGPIPPLWIKPPEGLCRNPFPYWPDLREDWSMTIYQAPSGAWVFNAGTNMWAWGLDDYYTGLKNPGGPDNGPVLRTQCGYPFFHPGLVSCRHPAVEQITRNVLNRFISGH